MKTRLKHHINPIICVVLIFIIYSCQDQKIVQDTMVKEINSTYNMQKTRNANSTYHYYYQGQKQELNDIVQNKEYILLKDISRSQKQYKFYNQPKSINVNEILTRSVQSDNIFWAVIEKKDIAENDDNIIYRAPIFNMNNEEYALGYLIYVKLKSTNDFYKLEHIASKFKIKIKNRNKYMPLWYTLECSESSKGNGLQIANKIYETGDFEESYPDLIPLGSDLCCVNDTYFKHQWYLSNKDYGLDLCNIRKLTVGDPSVIVAVVDLGIELNHPDLNIYNKSYDTETGKEKSNVYGKHGTLCAGFIGAKTNNNIGIASLAPACPLMSISNRLEPGIISSTEKRADGINFAWKNGASVINNSWKAGIKSAMIDEAVLNATTKGRNGKGSIVVFATGNNHGNSISYPSTINYDGVIAVGAIDSKGKRASFSQYGKGISIVAPGENVFTTTLNGGYTKGSGTSFASPLVSATAALILSVNPELTAKDVQSIICRSATKTEDYLFSENKEYGTWNEEVGYGILNTLKSVEKALNYDNTCIYGKTFSKDTNITGEDICTKDIIIKSGACLNLFCKNKIVINDSFIMEKGGYFSFIYNP